MSVFLRKFPFFESDTYRINRPDVEVHHYAPTTNAEVFELLHISSFIMRIFFFFVATFIIRIIAGHPLVSLDEPLDSNNLGLWDNGDLSSEQLLTGISGGNFLFDASVTTGDDLFTSDGLSDANDVGNLSGFSSFSSDLSLTNTEDVTDFALDAGGFGADFAEDASCGSQARKRDGSDDVLLGIHFHFERTLPMGSTDPSGSRCDMPFARRE